MHHPRITATLDLTEREWKLIRDSLRHFRDLIESPAAAWQHYKVSERINAVLDGETTGTTNRD